MAHKVPDEASNVIGITGAAGHRDEEKKPLLVVPRMEIKHGFFHPTRRFYSYLILFITCIMTVAGYFAHDAPGVIEAELMEDMKISGSQFGLLYSIYSLPNCILPFLGGFFLDKFGIKLGTFICVLLKASGATIVAVAPYFKSYYMMLFGRFVFGVGAETSYVAQNSIILYWFRDKEMALAMGINTSAGRLGSWFTYNINAMAVDYFHSWVAALWLGAVFSGLAFVMCILYVILDKIGEYITKQHEAIVEEPIDLRKVKEFPAIYWVVCLQLTFFYGVLFPLGSTAVNLLELRYKLDKDHAAFIASLLPLVSLVLSPIFGILVDKVGKFVLLVILGTLTLILPIGAMTFSFTSPIITLSVIGVAYALVPAAVFPYFPYIIDEQYMGTAYGLMTCIMNIGSILSYWFQGWLMDYFHNDTYYTLLFYLALSIVTLILCGIWLILDIRYFAQKRYDLLDSNEPERIPDMVYEAQKPFIDSAPTTSSSYSYITYGSARNIGGDSMSRKSIGNIGGSSKNMIANGSAKFRAQALSWRVIQKDG